MRKRQDIRMGAPACYLLTTTALLLFLVSACQPVLTAPAMEKSTATAEPTTEPSPTPIPVSSIPSTPAAPTRALTPTPDCRQAGGELVMETFFSEHLQAEFNVITYLPPCYAAASGNGFPVLYLLHGFSYTNDQWLRLGLADAMDSLIMQGEIPPFIIVLPEEARPKPPQVSVFPEILTEELIPWVDTNFATLPEKAFRGIGGLSRGAAWAVQIGLDHPTLFCCIGAHSLPLFEADGGKLNGWLTQTPADQLPRLFIDIGRDDGEWPTAQDFANQLDAAHVPHEWYLFRSGHTEAYWASHLDLYLSWYAKNW